MADLPLSKTIHPGDFDFGQLAVELLVVDALFTTERPQHEMRRWEYAMALRALNDWRKPRDYRYPRLAADVGGAGSPFYSMLRYPSKVEIIDPDGGRTLEQYLTAVDGWPMLFDAVFCLSVLEHVDDLAAFLYYLSCLVAPGGLLFLTADYCGQAGYPVVDRYHFHWMRRRIFNEHTWSRLMYDFIRRDFTPFGDIDFTWHGPQVYDYTFISLALTKRL